MIRYFVGGLTLLSLGMLASFAADAASPSGNGKPAPEFTLQCTGVPADDVLVNWGPMHVVGSNPDKTEMFELHAVVCWSTPMINTVGDKMTYSCELLGMYLARKGNPGRNTNYPSMFYNHSGLSFGFSNKAYNWSPTKPLEMTTEISLPDRTSSKVLIRSVPAGDFAVEGKGFKFSGKPFANEGAQGFDCMATIDGKFSMDGVSYESHGPLGGSLDLCFGVRAKEQGKLRTGIFQQ